MNKLIIFGVLSCMLLAHFESASALRCYDCKVPNQECLLNYQNKVADCDNEFLSGAVSTFTGQKKVCMKYSAGQFAIRGCFVDSGHLCDGKEHCATCDTDLCNAADSKMMSTFAIITSAVLVMVCKLFY